MSIIDFPQKKINRKKVLLFSLIVFMLIVFMIITFLYYFNLKFRTFFDIKILRKEINSEKLSYIEITAEEDQYFTAYDKYIVILNKNILSNYISSGEKVAENTLNIKSPIFASNNKFLVIGENNGSQIYCFSGTNIIWQDTLEGNISQININQNGYVSVTISGTSYKSIVLLFSPKGELLFKTYISTNYVIKTAVSNDNKILSLAEIDSSGSIIKSSVKLISIDKANTDSTNSILYTYSLGENSIISNICFDNKNHIICLTTDNITSLDLSTFEEKVLWSTEDKYEFVDINVKNCFTYTENQLKNFNNICTVNICNISSMNIAQYTFNGSLKNITTTSSKIALCLGSEIHFISSNGWLIKKYTSYLDSSLILVGDSIAGILEKNKIIFLEI